VMPRDSSPSKFNWAPQNDITKCPRETLFRLAWRGCKLLRVLEYFYWGFRHVRQEKLLERKGKK
jgi:hypothetical protein